MYCLNVFCFVCMNQRKFFLVNNTCLKKEVFLKVNTPFNAKVCILLKQEKAVEAALF